MRAGIINRLRAIEKQYNQEPMIVLAVSDTGERLTMTMRECLERPDTYFEKVVSGHNLDDLDLLLNDMKEEAQRGQQG